MPRKPETKQSIGFIAAPCAREDLVDWGAQPQPPAGAPRHVPLLARPGRPAGAARPVDAAAAAVARPRPGDLLRAKTFRLLSHSSFLARHPQGGAEDLPFRSP